ncbi:CPBP family intramembrane glutamic endopeptidase [Streptomyces palmae]|uniref:CPBP family intramembrane metalloprotease n=1 Tax=Streptomyces palmae TaxID=1701085 RepID=A0A4Z0GZU0_9ACTN|nr:CPBP family intramembrane glutamic endopeptidase [Streptomyces palmae]TGB03271.1 CPBP family intramembrane metalloprotease [Streptomyces palmae]
MRLVWQLSAVAVVAMVGGQAVAAVQEGNPWLTLALGTVTSVLAVLAYGWVVRRTERRAVTELDRKGAAAGLGLGTLLGLALFGSVVANLAFLGYFQVTGRSSASGAAGLLGFMAAAAVTEELLFRGVLFRVVEERTGTWWAMALSGVLFGAYHLSNPDASLYGAVAVAIEAGGMLTAAYIATRKLWVPIGLHFGWNFAGAGIFSTEVSGNGSTHGLLDSVTTGPALATGGDFGPEGSPYALVMCVLAAIVFLLVARRRGCLVPSRGHAERVPAVATLPR